MFLQSRRRARRGERLDTWDVGRIRLRVLPTDLDVLGHMNNGVYLSIFDLGRFDLLDGTMTLPGFPRRNVVVGAPAEGWDTFVEALRGTGFLA